MWVEQELQVLGVLTTQGTAPPLLSWSPESGGLPGVAAVPLVGSGPGRPVYWVQEEVQGPSCRLHSPERAGAQLQVTLPVRIRAG